MRLTSTMTRTAALLCASATALAAMGTAVLAAEPPGSSSAASAAAPSVRSSASAEALAVRSSASAEALWAAALASAEASLDLAADLSRACPSRSLPPTDFTDLDVTHGDAVRCMSWYGLVNGVTAQRYASSATVTRGQIASLLTRTLERAGVSLSRPERPRFSDTRGVTHGDAFERLAEAGVLRGTSAGTADLASGITRGQLATMVVGAAEAAQRRSLPPGSDAFTDDDGNHHEAAINAAANAGLVAGDRSGRYRPSGRLTRAQAATVLARVVNRFVAEGRVTRPAPAPMRWEPQKLPSAIRQQMTGVSWSPGCPVALDDLRLVVLTHRGFDGRQHRGELVVHHSVVRDLERVFRAMFAADVPIQRIERIERFGGDDDRSMAANNSSAFNCRRVSGGSSWSEHAYGTAIDLNPIQNPYVRGSTVLPPAGRSYLDRGNVRPGMFVDGDATVRAFDAIGWGWGGRWNSLKDYQHFSRSGR